MFKKKELSSSFFYATYLRCIESYLGKAKRETFKKTRLEDDGFIAMN